MHEVENTGYEPSEFLRVELKTEPVQAASFVGKFGRPSTPSAEPVLHFNHPQVAISRLWIQPSQELEVSATTEPVLLIALAPVAEMRRGESRWIAASGRTRLRNGSSSLVDLLRFDLKTAPRQTR